MKLDDDPGKRGTFLVQSFMSGEQKVLLSLEMSMFDQEIRKQRIRRDHPEWSELEVKHEIFRHAFLPKPVPEWLEKLMKQRLDEQRARQSTGLE
jgi:transcriptional regulator of met regulon